MLNQDYDNWEHIIVDGGSTDNTLEVLKKYPHLNWVSEPDRGIYDAMNKGIKIATGGWVYFMGGDDRLKPNALKIIAEAAGNQDLDVIYGDVWSTRFGGRHDGKFDYKKIYDKNICHQSIFFSRKVFQSLGDFSIKYKSHADWDHNMRWFLNGKTKHKYIDCVIAEYADGGYSSVNPDDIFARDKRFNYIKYGRKTAPGIFMERLCKQEIKEKNSFYTRKIFAFVILILVKYF